MKHAPTIAQGNGQPAGRPRVSCFPQCGWPTAVTTVRDLVVFAAMGKHGQRPEEVPSG